MLLLALALVLLPGLLVVRAPWTAVAPLSLAFWTLGAWWPPFAGPGRSRVVIAVLTASLLLALLRLVPKHELAPPPGWQPPPAPKPPARPGLAPPPLAGAPSLAVLGTALALLAPLPLWHHAPGPRLAFQTTAARLLVWRDGIPASFEPLLPLEPVGAHAPALATLAADVSLLTGADPGPALLWVVAAAAGLVLVGLFALHATWAPPQAAALGSLVALAVAPWPGFLSVWGEGEALARPRLPAARSGPPARSRVALLGRGRGRAACRGRPRPAGARGVRSAARVRLCPRSPRARRSSLRKARGQRAPRPGPGLTRPRPSRPSPFGARVAGDPDREPDARAGAVRVRAAARGPGTARLRSDRSTPLGRRRGPAVAGATLLAGLLLVARVHGWFASGQLSERTRTALARVAAVTSPLESVCAGEGERDFVPALAGRRAGEPGPWIPRVYADEWARRERRPCDARLSDFGAAR